MNPAAPVTKVPTKTPLTVRVEKKQRAVPLHRSFRSSMKSPASNRAAMYYSKHKSCGPSVRIEHFHCLQGIVVEILSDKVKLDQNVVCHCNDMAADCVRLEDIEQLARACPNQFGIRRLSEAANCLGHQRHRIDASIGDATRKDRDIGRSATLHRVDHGSYLFEREKRRDVEWNAFLCQPRAQR